MKRLNDYKVRSHRIYNALTELRIARRLGRMLSHDEAARIEGIEADMLALRELLFEHGWRLKPQKRPNGRRYLGLVKGLAV